MTEELNLGNIEGLLGLSPRTSGDDSANFFSSLHVNEIIDKKEIGLILGNRNFPNIPSEI